MITRTRVQLNSVQLDGVDSKVIVQGVREYAPSWTQVTQILGSGHGQLSMQNAIKEKTIAVGFSLNVKKTDGSSRRTLQDAVNAWAMSAVEGAWLSTNERPNKRIWVILSALPEEGLVKEWNAEYTMTFKTLNTPAWMDTNIQTSASVSSVNNTGSMPTPAFIEITPSGGTVNALTVRCGSTSLTFASLGLSGSNKLEIGVDPVYSNIMYAKIGNTSVMNKITSGSDLLMLNPGTNAVSATAGAVASVKFYRRWI